MDVILIILGALLMIAGIVGCFLPVIPGPPLNYLGLILLQFTKYSPFTTKFLIIWAIITILVVVLDYVIPAYGTKRFGGSSRGVWGSVIGLVLGLILFPPFGIIIGPFVGAFLGELSLGLKANVAFKSALGSFIGFLAGTLLKLIASVFMAYYFVISLPSIF